MFLIRFVRMMFRLLPVFVLIYVLDQSSETFHRSFKKVAGMAESAMVMGEMNLLKAMIMKDIASGGSPPSDFASYCSTSMKRRGKTSDIPPYKDRWRNEYYYEILGKKSFRITSAGPDGILGSEDDLIVEY